MASKTCTKCGIEKDISEFSKLASGKLGVSGCCKECKRSIDRANGDKIRARQNKFYRDNTEKVKERKKAYYERNKEAVNAHMKEYINERKKTDPVFAASLRLRVLTRSALKRKKFSKRCKTSELLGCTTAELLAMWGIDTIPRGYEIDHIVPLAQAQTVEEVEKLCHYTNLRLITASDNRAKRDYMTSENAQLCKALLGRSWIHKHDTAYDGSNIVYSSYCAPRLSGTHGSY